MKKLMLTLTAIALAVVANASACNWDNGNGDLYVSSGSGDAASGYLVYLVDAGVTSSSALEAAISSGDYSFTSTAWAADGLSDAGWVEGTDSSPFTAGSSYSLYLVAFDAGTIDAAKNYYISAAEDVSFKGSGVPSSVSFDLSATASAGAWTATAAPEPTSGLLLLFGLAGLALKRKRA